MGFPHFSLIDCTRRQQDGAARQRQREQQAASRGRRVGVSGGRQVGVSRSAGTGSQKDESVTCVTGREDDGTKHRYLAASHRCVCVCDWLSALRLSVTATSRCV